MVSTNDIIIVQRGSTCGKVALIKGDLGPTTINPSLVLLKEITEFPEYVFLGIKVVLNGILNLVSKTAIPMLTQFQINNIEIPVPPKQEQRDIIMQNKNDTQLIDDAISLKEKEIEKLKEYKATLINSAVTGKIKVW
jgi:type I restriction enzyme S subunit